MRLTINTTTLQALLAKSIRGASNNKFLPLTSMIAIELKNSVLTLITTDGTNYLYVKDSNVSGDDFYCVAPADKLVKLISKFTCETTTFENTDTELTVNGNGTYKIELSLDSDGQPIKFPNPIDGIELNGDKTISVGVINTILTSVKPSLLVGSNASGSLYSNYYVGDVALATDSYKISVLNNKVFEEPHLISNELMNLLALADSDMTTTIVDNKIVFSSDDLIIYGVEQSGIETFNITAITNYTKQDFGKECKVVRNDLINALDRISLFVGAYDSGAIKLTFTDSDVTITSKLSTGSDTVDYCEVNNADSEYECLIDVNSLMLQLKSHIGDTITIQYGSDRAIKLIGDEVTSIVALNG